MTYQRLPEISEISAFRFEIAKVGKATAHSTGKPLGPRESWPKGEKELLRLKNARSVVEGLLKSLNDDIAELEARVKP